MKRSARGNHRELLVGQLMEAEGWTVGSRRHIPGPGDWLMVRQLPSIRHIHDVRLVEVKSTVGGPFHSFVPEDRKAMIDLADKLGATAWLAWWPPRGKLQLIPEEDWPPLRNPRVAGIH